MTSQERRAVKKLERAADYLQETAGKREATDGGRATDLLIALQMKVAGQLEHCTALEAVALWHSKEVTKDI